MKKMSFHFGIFYHAVIGYLGRKPDVEACLGGDGFYQFIYVPRNETEIKEFEHTAIDIREWMDHFDLTPSKSECRFTAECVYAENFTKGKKLLLINIQHEVINEAK